MEDYIWILTIIGISITWWIISWIIETISNSKKYLELKPKLDDLENSIKEHELKVGKDREGAGIQCFSDDYKFYGSRTDRNLHIGNAVSTFLSVALANSISKNFKEEELI